MSDERKTDDRITELLDEQAITRQQAATLRSLRDDFCEGLIALGERHGVTLDRPAAGQPWPEVRTALKESPEFLADFNVFGAAHNERWNAIVDADEPGDYSWPEIGFQYRDRRPDRRDPAYRTVERIREHREDQAARRAYLHASGLMR